MRLAEMCKRLPAPPMIARTWEELMHAEPKAVLESDLLVDAILGTGFKPPVSGVYAEAIRQINASKAPVTAVDIPSGPQTQTRPARRLARSRAPMQSLPSPRRVPRMFSDC